MTALVGISIGLGCVAIWAAFFLWCQRRYSPPRLKPSINWLHAEDGETIRERRPGDPPSLTAKERTR